ncbi:DUF6056 family protein [Escherichia fergusonii]|uniref:DUF6056 family protein n=1 Tax=Escherichia fergusonii TaxID=564 RepID=UPI0015EA53CC|nr:DUF6056 family protein [Escherichia fergusonii]EFH9068534.1 hypothetical protein [Escherichia coli]MBA8233408.1 hypothetical protein [Escherichia fergusonii]MBA8245456.1 hypothetical protein [Escherichia fergusonii]MBA8274693.1 hypothetical protein [Escherichia fergusonii]QMF77097.1 hypothetical protein HVY75_06400 [Escherichia fergusonii]
MFKSKVNIVIFAIGALLFSLIALNTPMHSDDYGYLYKGLSISSHYDHYMNWSGRIVADYVSSGLMSIGDHNIVAVLNSLAVTFLIYLICSIPSAIEKKSTNPFAFIIIYTLYWVSNPNIGQNSFWVVGSANYAWTTMFAFLFIYVFIKKHESRRPQDILLVFILALIAGCSNENTSVTLVFGVLVSMAYLYKTKKVSMPMSIFASVGVIIGCALMILAPGNYVRAKHPSFAAWQSLDLSERIFRHLTRRMDFPFISAWACLIVISLCVIIYIIQRNKNKLRLITPVAIFGALAFVLFVIDNLVLVGAPYTPPRSFSSGFCFLLLVTSSCIYLIQRDTKDNGRLVSIAISVPLLAIFSYCYLCMYSAYQRTMIQQQLRVESIKYGRSIGDDVVSIPDFYFTKLYNENDKFDIFHNHIAVGTFHGIKSAPLHKAYFDYSGIYNKPIKKVNIEIFKGLRMSGIFLSAGGVINGDTLIFEFNKNPDEIINESTGNKFTVHVIDANGEMIKYDFFPKSISLNGKYYSAIDLGKVKFSDIESFFMGSFKGPNRYSYHKIDI